VPPLPPSYWLKISPQKKVSDLLQEANELTAIFFAAITTTRSRKETLPKS
jgi:hypothetical protein